MKILIDLLEGRAWTLERKVNGNVLLLFAPADERDTVFYGVEPIQDADVNRYLLYYYNDVRED
jgi:hypothetical protein